MADTEDKRKTKKTATADTLEETPHPKRNTYGNRPSLAESCPELTKEWDYERNNKTPWEITAGSEYKAHWICPDEECLHYKYQAKVLNRTIKGGGCPVKAGRATVIGYNDLNTTHKDLSQEWDYEANADSGYTPYNITAGSNYKAHWICPDEDCGHYKYQAYVYIRSAGGSCPVKAGRATVIGYNDLMTTHKHLSLEWDYEANADSGYTPYNITAGSHYKAYWICPDEDCGHYKYQATVKNRAHKKYHTGCPVKAGKTVVVGRNDLNTTHKHLSLEWDYEANAESGYTPYNITAGNGYRAQWICPNEECGHYEYSATVCDRTRKKPRGCPACAKTGFSANMVGYLYFISGTCLEKIGITNYLADRLKKHEPFAPNLLDVWAGKGSAVYSAEQMILKMINDPASGIDVCLKHGEKFDGCKETWSLSDITPNPKNLPELIDILSKLNLSVDSVDLEALGLRRLTREETVRELSS